MKVFELAKELNLSTKEVIDTLNGVGYEIKSHMSSLTDEEADLMRLAVSSTAEQEEIVPEEKPTIVKSTKKFVSGDLIECKCVRPNKVIYYSSKTQTRYEWNGFGDIVEVDYADLMKMKSSKDSMLFQPKIVIEDEDLYSQWARDLEKVYKDYSGLDYPEKLFDMNDVLFKAKLQNSPKAIRELIKITATHMIKEGTFNSLSKLSIIDEVLGTCLKEFI